MNKDKVIESIDLDEWKHSLHNKLETKEDYLKALDIVSVKLSARIRDLEILRSAMIFLVDEIANWEKYYE